MGRLDNLRYVDTFYTAIAQGFAVPEMICDKIFKKAVVETEIGKYPEYTDNFLTAFGADIKRALRTKPQMTEWQTPILKDFYCESYALSGVIDYREASEHKKYGDLLKEGVEEQRKNILITKEKLGADVITDPNNYNSTHKDIPATKWDVNTDLLLTIMGYKEIIRQSIGIEPNTLILGNLVWNTAFKRNVKFLDSIKYTQKGILTSDLVASLLDLQNVYIGQGIYKDGTIPEIVSTPTVRHDIWGNMACLCYVNPANGENIPTFARSFQRDPYPLSRVWVDEGGMLTRYSIEDVFDLKITGPNAGFLVTDPV